MRRPARRPMFALPARDRGFVMVLAALALATAAGGCDPASHIAFDVDVAGQHAQSDDLTVARALVAVDAVAARQGFSPRTHATSKTGEAHENYELDELTDERPPQRRQIVMSASYPKEGLLRITLIEFISWHASPRLREIADDLYVALRRALGAGKVVRRN